MGHLRNGPHQGPRSGSQPAGGMVRCWPDRRWRSLDPESHLNWNPYGEQAVEISLGLVSAPMKLRAR